MNSGPQSGMNFVRAMADQGPRYDKKKKFGPNQIQGKKLIRPDKRKKVKYL